MMLRETRIHIPRKLATVLHRDRNLEAGVLSTLADFEPWLEDNKLVFFPEFTDHGPDHIASVISTATFLITNPSWKILTPGDAAALAISILLHDCAMHLSEDGFIALVSNGGFDIAAKGEPSWPQLWEAYIREAVRFDGRKLFALFGDNRPIEIPRLSALDFSLRDRMLIGDFLRRHHARLAYEIAIVGVPGPVDDRLGLTGFSGELRAIFGWIARSHGMSIRQAVSRFPRNSRRLKLDVHITYIMALLRIADYLQIEGPRAPKEVLQVRSLRSPLSQSEWAAHRVIAEITSVDDDRESLHVVAQPPTSKEFVHVTKLLHSLQNELDQTWAVLGEVYGPVASLQKLGLTIRRIRSNLDDVESFAQEVNYVPIDAAFTTASADLLKLLIGPLYSYRSEIGIRELLQNAVDAVLERRDSMSHVMANGQDLNRRVPDVTINLVTDSEEPHITITDTGVGMSVEILLNYFLRAGASFRSDEAWKTLHTDSLGHSRVLRSGRFGIGALAAFLLAESLKVTTCSESAEGGITFKARLEDEHIELTRTSAPIGTTIHIPLESYIADHLESTHLWDFYCLQDPIVERRLNGKVLEQREKWPGCGALLPSRWRRLETVDFADVQWTFWEPEVRTQIACNGIRVEEIKMEEEPGGDRYDEDDDEDVNEDRTPLRLSIFDKEARLPVNLQRTAVTTLPFRRALDEEIAKDFLAFAAIRLPTEISLNSVFAPRLRYPGQPSPDISRYLRHYSRNSDRSLSAPCFFATPEGWILPIYRALQHFRPTRFVQIIATPPGPSFIWTKADYVCPSVEVFEGYGSDAFTKRFLSFADHRLAIKILVPKHTMLHLMKQEDVAETIIGAQTTPFRDEYLLIDFDKRNPTVVFEEPFHEHMRPNKENHYFIVEVVEENEERDSYAANEGDDFERSEGYDFEHGEGYDFERGIERYHSRHGGVIQEGPRLPIPYDLALSVWTDLGVHSIPFAMEDRSFILEHPHLGGYVDSHAKLWDAERGAHH